MVKLMLLNLLNPVSTDSGGSKGGPGRAWAHPINEGPDFFFFFY